MEEILADPDVDAALNVLPVHVALEVPSVSAVIRKQFVKLKVSRKCWRAGKHVLQEKPLGRSVQEAMTYLKEYRTQNKALWQFAENYRSKAHSLLLASTLFLDLKRSLRKQRVSAHVWGSY